MNEVNGRGALVAADQLDVEDDPGVSSSEFEVHVPASSAVAANRAVLVDDTLRAELVRSHRRERARLWVRPDRVVVAGIGEGLELGAVVAGIGEGLELGELGDRRGGGRRRLELGGFAAAVRSASTPIAAVALVEPACSREKPTPPS